MIYNQWVVVDEYGIWMLIGVIYIYIVSVSFLEIQLGLKVYEL